MFKQISQQVISFISVSLFLAICSFDAMADSCEVVNSEIRSAYDSDVILCGENLPPDISIDNLDETGIELLYKQRLKECNWDDERPGYHLVFKASNPAKSIFLPVSNAATGGPLCDLELTSLPAKTVNEPAWVSDMPLDSAKTVDVDGINTYYYEAGDGSPLILLHGGQMGGYNNHARKWMPNFKELSKTFRVIAIDRLGQGRTDNLKDPEDFPDYYSHDVTHLEGFMEALGLENVTVVGHSQAGWPATRVALNRPDLVSCLVNVGTVMVPDDGKLMKEALDFITYVSARGPLHPESGPTFYSARRGMYLRYISGNNISDENAQVVVDQYASSKIQQAHKPIQALRLNPAHPTFYALRDQAYRDIKAGKLKVRSLVIFGDGDRQTPLGLGKMFNSMLDEAGVETKLAIVKGAGHAPHTEFPEIFNGHVVDYCGSN